MIENSWAGMVMLQPAVGVTVTREEHHQQVLARYPVTADTQRQVAVELSWCTISSGKYRGERAVEVRLDGHRVGELTYAMSRRYGPIVNAVAARGGRPACEALVHLGKRGIELELRLPHQAEPFHAPPLPPMIPVAPAAPMPSAGWMAPVGPMSVPSAVPQPRKGTFAAHRPLWIAAGVVGVVFFAAVTAGGSDSPTASDSQGVGATITTTTTVSTTTSTPPPTTVVTSEALVTTTVAATKAPAPATTRKPTRSATPPPAPAAAPAPKPTCDPNYTGCVPISSDVDCAGGSGNGPAYVRGPVRVIGSDIYGLDHDKDGTGCE